ncbi:hypothetical protein QVH35_06850 [Candidatus Nitrosotenuis chungbukensis]|uniref:hypothetical protein n=1 Tax=Candidatus Nitrosotenuis chungbukensis TaxID=1353246 RepID=UPI002672F4B0|nr:hypothetical protein [Candidatus Nitrosotenuis chungbukensis]WKT57157.1 hypothetical protein QVH35_06850 [Candidatus Nitrosotenuis chungbukensis]
MAQVKATVHGAVSIVNAIATGKGATLGIAAKVEATVEASDGHGIEIEVDNHNMSFKAHQQGSRVHGSKKRS